MMHDTGSYLRGLANFYRRLVAEYAKVTVPITNLLREDAVFERISKAQADFEELKRSFTTAPVLRRSNPAREMRLETHASDYGLSVTSRKWILAECNYQTYDQEMLAIVYSFKTWRHDFSKSEKPTQVHTDHNNLVGLAQLVQAVDPTLVTSVSLQQSASESQAMSGWSLTISHLGRCFIQHYSHVVRTRANAANHDAFVTTSTCPYQAGRIRFEILQRPLVVDVIRLQVFANVKLRNGATHVRHECGPLADVDD